MSGQLHVLTALPPGKEPLVPIGYEAGWTQWQREKSHHCMCWELNPGHPSVGYVKKMKRILKNM